MSDKIMESEDKIIITDGFVNIKMIKYAKNVSTKTKPGKMGLLSRFCL